MKYSSFQAEATFLEARAKERSIMREMVSTREKLKHVRERLSHVDYSNPMYLQLASEQHALVTEEDRCVKILFNPWNTKTNVKDTLHIHLFGISAMFSSPGNTY